MQLIDQDLGRRHFLTPEQAARVMAAIEEGRLSFDLGEAMDFEGDLVLPEDILRSCLQLALGNREGAQARHRIGPPPPARSGNRGRQAHTEKPRRDRDRRQRRAQQGTLASGGTEFKHG